MAGLSPTTPGKSASSGSLLACDAAMTRASTEGVPITPTAKLRGEKEAAWVAYEGIIYEKWDVGYRLHANTSQIVSKMSNSCPLPERVSAGR